MKTSLEKAQEVRRQQLADGEAAPPKTKWQKWKANNTRKTSIEAFCAHCMGCTPEEDPPGYREEIRHCTSGPGSAAECPLFKWRPYKLKGEE